MTCFWILSGCPLDDFAFDMKNDARSSYHKYIYKTVVFVLNIMSTSTHPGSIL